MTATTMTCDAPPVPPAATAILPGYWHASDRLRERHGLELTPAEFARLSGLVADRDARALRLARHDPTSLLVAFHLGGRWVPGVWADPTRTVVTFLPDRALDPYRGWLARVDDATRGEARP